MNTFNGWKTILDSKNAWVQYNTVDFGNKKLDHLGLRVRSETGSTIQLRLNKWDGPVIAEIKVPKSPLWSTVEAKVTKPQRGIRNLVMVLTDDKKVEVDWVKFE